MEKRALLIVFTRNPELGKVKTRLAAEVGDQAALDIYQALLRHTRDVTSKLTVDREVHYSNHIPDTDIWPAGEFRKVKQRGEDLGRRMANAFMDAFASDIKK